MQQADIVSQSLIEFEAIIWVFRALDRLPSVSGSKDMQKISKHRKDFWREAMGIFLIYPVVWS